MKKIRNTIYCETAKLLFKGKEDSITCRVMMKLFGIAGLFYIVCYIIFAVLPAFGLSVATGGWDWLSFVGGIAGTLFACWGVITTIESTHEDTLQQAILSARPMLKITANNHANLLSMENMDGFYFKYSVEKQMITINGVYQLLGETPISTSMDKYLLLRVANIGLGAAVDVRIKLYKVIEKENGWFRKIETAGMVDLYENVEVCENAVEIGNDMEISEGFFYEMPAFHLNNDSSCHYILLEQEMFKGSPAHYIAKIHYYGMYGEQYVQEQYFVFEESIVRCVYTSKQKKYDIHSS